MLTGPARARWRCAARRGRLPLTAPRRGLLGGLVVTYLFGWLFLVSAPRGAGPAAAFAGGVAAFLPRRRASRSSWPRSSPRASTGPSPTCWPVAPPVPARSRWRPAEPSAVRDVRPGRPAGRRGRRPRGTFASPSPSTASPSSARTARASRPCCAASTPSPRPTSGRVLLDLPGAGGPVDPARHPARARAAVGFVFTDPDAQVVMPTPAEDVALSLRRLRLPTAGAGRPRGRGAGPRRAADRADVSVHDLSSGQRQLLAVAAVLATAPRLLVIDEPTTLLDLRNTRLLRRTVDAVDGARRRRHARPRPRGVVPTGSSSSTAAAWSPTTPRADARRLPRPPGRRMTARTTGRPRSHARGARVRRPSLVPAAPVRGRRCCTGRRAGTKLLVLAVAAVARRRRPDVGTAGRGGPARRRRASCCSPLAGHARVRHPGRGARAARCGAWPCRCSCSPATSCSCSGPVRGAEVVLDLSGLSLLAAGLVTRDHADGPAARHRGRRSSRPLRAVPGLRPHLHPDRVALTFTLALRSVDVLWDVAAPGPGRRPGPGPRPRRPGPGHPDRGPRRRARPGDRRRARRPRPGRLTGCAPGRRTGRVTYSLRQRCTALRRRRVLLT